MKDFSKNREEFWKNVGSKYFLIDKGRGKLTKGLITDFVKTHRVSSVLELGCNTGKNLLAISEVTQGIHLVGIDICEDAIKFGKEVEQNPARLLVGSIYDLAGFKDNSFDLVFTRGVLLHINHIKTPMVIKEMLRITKKHIFHIERHSIIPEVQSYAAGNIPHAFSHNFKEIYGNFGLIPKVAKVRKLIGQFSKGGADHFVSVEI
jgi:ubiquinone/menaquinone biosynthesis C-methylase UbiE